MKRRFAELTAREALQAAIAIERRNTELYENLTRLFGGYDGKLAEVFAAMAREEIEHRRDLETYLQQHLPGEHPAEGADPPVVEVVEAPDLDAPEAFVFDDVTVEQAIEMAGRAEASACEFYGTIAREASDPGLRRLCEHMAGVEADHRETFAAWKRRQRKPMPGGPLN